MIPAALFAVAPSLDPARRLRIREVLRDRPGSEWWELVLRGSLAMPERWAGPPHGDPSRWDWGFTVRSLAEADQRRQHLERLARNMTPEQLAELWQDTSEQAAALRRVIRAGCETRYSVGDQVTPVTINQVLERWRRVAASITFRKAWPWKMRIDVRIAELTDALDVRITMLDVPDMFTGEPSKVIHHRDVIYQRAHRMDEAEILHFLRKFLRDATEHELDECLLVGGEQLRDPHKAPGTRAA